MKPPPKPRQPYTPADDEKLILLAAAGFNADEVAAVLGRTPLSVLSRATWLTKRQMTVWWDARPNMGARAFLQRGGIVHREEHDWGFNKVVYWTTAHRPAPCTFSMSYTPALYAAGLLIQVPKYINDGENITKYRFIGELLKS
jgi:hypothetical protein